MNADLDSRPVDRAEHDGVIEADAWVAVCGVEDIPRLGARRVQRPSGPPAAVFRTADDRVFALLDRCPHKGGPLSQGLVFGERVACPLHDWSIGLADGCAAAPDVGRTTRFDVRVEQGVVMLSAAALAAGEPAVEASACAAAACGAAPAR